MSEQKREAPPPERTEIEDLVLAVLQPGHLEEPHHIHLEVIHGR